MEHTITPHPGILGIAPYRAGKSAGAPGVEVVKLSSNENPFGPGDRALEAFRRAQGALNRYPDPAHTVLREAIGAAHGIDPETVVCGNGSDEILHLLAQAYLGPDADGAPTEAIMSEHGFLVYPIVTRAAGGRPVIVQERTRVSDVDAILAAAGPRTRLVFLANPNNPTGTMIGVDELARLADGLPSQVLLVLDGAYAEFAEDYDGGRSLVAGRENVFITRTFSKLYGLGGLRIGWGHGPRAVVEVLNRIRGPFNLSEPQMAAAAAALTDHEHIRRTLSENARLRVWLAEALARAGVPSDPSQANFVLAQFVNPDMAHACDDWLQARGLLVRRVDEYGLAHCLRITVGDEAACRRVVHAVGEFMAARNAPADGEMFA